MPLSEIPFWDFFLKLLSEVRHLSKPLFIYKIYIIFQADMQFFKWCPMLIIRITGKFLPFSQKVDHHDAIFNAFRHRKVDTLRPITFFITD